MEFITVKEFKEQSQEMQKVFLDWWKPSVGDLFTWIGQDKHNMSELGCCCSELQAEITYKNKGVDNRIPLFTEGQLRKFIEDKLEQIHYENDGRKIELDITHNNGFTRIEEGIYGSAKGVKRVEWIIENELSKKYDLIQAYWKVACIVAEEGLNG